MKVIGLDNCEYNLKLDKRANDRECSSYHVAARKLLKEMFLFDQIREEVFLPGCKGSLYLDFFLPLRKLAVEVQGEQHYRFIPHFHGQQIERGFVAGQKRDRDKREFCEINSIILVEFPYTESVNEWRERVNNAWSG